MTLPEDVTDPLAEYSVSFAVGDGGREHLSISHNSCVWHEEVDAIQLLARLVSLAFEHRIMGCKSPRPRRSR